MKRIFNISFILALVLGASSCNMDLRPYSVIDPDNALETYADAVKLANGFNNNIRSLAVGTRVSAPEIQADFFHATTTFGNRGGDAYRWMFTASYGSAESVWASCYTVIANANYFISKVDYVENRVAEDEAFAETWSDEELELLKGHLAEAYFVRAYAHSILVDRYCAAYDPATANAENSGIPYVKEYVPTSDKEKYPARQTLKENIVDIMTDLSEAEKTIGNLRDPEAGSNYITVDAIKALRARVALSCQDYAQAIQDATSIINSGTYALVGSVAALQKLWKNDDAASEVILQSVVVIKTEMPGSNDYNYMGYNYDKAIYTPDYVPAKWLVDLYDDKDIRKQIFFFETPIQTSSGQSTPIYIFTKFPGNPALSSAPSDLHYCNAPKPFRLAELYLIAIEAYVASGVQGGDQAASDLMNELKSNRIEGYTAKTYTAGELRAEVKDERVRELVGEGFRLSDLKRYGAGITRSEAQLSSVLSQPGQTSTELLSKTAEDYRFVWPIPTTETDANPKIKQNPGYTN